MMSATTFHSTGSSSNGRRRLLLSSLSFALVAFGAQGFLVPVHQRALAFTPHHPHHQHHENNPLLHPVNAPPAIFFPRDNAAGDPERGRFHDPNTAHYRHIDTSLHGGLSLQDSYDLGRSLPPAAAALAQSLLQSGGNVPFLQSLGLNAVLFAAASSKLRTMLTPAGIWHALALGTGLWTTLGWRGWTTCVVYLMLGQAVTKVRFDDKEKRGLAEKRGGRRGPENVWGSAATALMCAVAASQADPTFLGVGRSLYLLGFVASLATKLADTFASEIGKAYGKTTFLITTFERVPPGTEGAVSVEGTAAAVVGGLLLSLYGRFVGLIDSPYLVAVSTIAAFLATNVESVLGATLQEKKGFEWMTNEVINFFNTLIGAAIAMTIAAG